MCWIVPHLYSHVQRLITDHQSARFHYESSHSHNTLHSNTMTVIKTGIQDLAYRLDACTSAKETGLNFHYKFVIIIIVFCLATKTFSKLTFQDNRPVTTYTHDTMINSMQVLMPSLNFLVRSQVWFRDYMNFLMAVSSSPRAA